MAPGSSEIRIVMADDHPVVRHGLRQIVATDPGLQIVAEAGDGKAALDQIRTHRPEVAVLDIDMPGMDGFAVARAVEKERLAVQIVFLTVHHDEELFRAALELGVNGYVLKDTAATDIVASIRSVAAGRPYVSPSLSAHIVQHVRRAGALGRDKPHLQDLTPMERRILKLIAEDKTSKTIAEQLFISPRTVETHRTNICRKLDLHGSLALVKFALEHKSDF
jgi:DNA-binding NarL/FixJ family response regulator